MDEVAITLPHLRYGYRETPLTWKDLHQFIVVEKDVEKMARSVSQQQDYERFKLQLRRKWRSMMDYVLCDKFDIESMVDPETSLRYAVDRKDLQTSPSAAVAVDNDYDSVKQARLKLTRNDFPYYLDEGIEHWILWKLGGSPISEQEILNAKTKLAARSTEEINMDFLHWINPPHVQSLPGIDHVHILCRTNKTCSGLCGTNEDAP